MTESIKQLLLVLRDMFGAEAAKRIALQGFDRLTIGEKAFFGIVLQEEEDVCAEAVTAIYREEMRKMLPKVSRRLQKKLKATRAALLSVKP